MQAIQISTYGEPAEVLELANIPEPAAPGANQVLIAVEFAPINNSDLLLVRGTYPIQPKLPSAIGNEGVGRILEVGPGVTHVKVDDRVLAPLSSFTWRERMAVAAEELFALPSQADPQQLAMLLINPGAAGLMLQEFVPLQAGDWIVQNAANSAVGRWVISFAKKRGIKTINLVRRAELVEEIKGLGGDLVYVDSPDLAPRVGAAVRGGNIRLALDGVCGQVTGALTSIVSPDGVVVVYAVASQAPISASPFDLMLKAVSIRGFFMGLARYADKLRPILEQAATMIADREVQIPVAAVYPLSSIKEAVQHAERGGKVLLAIGG